MGEVKKAVMQYLKLHITQSYLMEEVMKTYFFWMGSEYLADTEVIKKDDFEDFLMLCHYWPLTVKRNRNVSNTMYRVFNPKAKKNNDDPSLIYMRYEDDSKRTKIAGLLNYINRKIL